MKNSSKNWKQISKHEEELILNGKVIFQIYQYNETTENIDAPSELEEIEKVNGKWFISSTSPSYHLIEKEHVNQLLEGFETAEIARALCNKCLHQLANQILELS